MRTDSQANHEDGDFRRRLDFMRQAASSTALTKAEREYAIKRHNRQLDSFHG